MSGFDVAKVFPRGLLRPELFVGVVSSSTARTVGVNLNEAGQPSGSHYAGNRYGRGEVGEYILIEGQQSLLLGRISEVSLREPERRSIKRSFSGNLELDAIGKIQLLGCVSMETLRVTIGVDAYPRLGDRIYAAPQEFISLLPQFMEPEMENEKPLTLNIGATENKTSNSGVALRPERLFGRHCAILGATGGGKSWTTARIIEECLNHNPKMILIDATGEFCGFRGSEILHCHLGNPTKKAFRSISCSLPPTSFLESDFVALFEPAGKVQGPKMRAAIKSLRLAQIREDLASNGIILKHNRMKQQIVEAETDPDISVQLENPRQPFDVTKLVAQIEQECVWPNGGTLGNPNYSTWGGPDESSYANCLALFSRINGVLSSHAFKCVFFAESSPSLTDKISTFQRNKKKLLRIDLSGIYYEFNAREMIANVIGRHLLICARSNHFRQKPTVILVDEAHNFLGRRIGGDDYVTKLDAFELIAKEGRKYGLNLCLATQRPRDIPPGVLSQMGTLIVHRLTNDQDRESVESACGEIDRAASCYLPNLRPGEATVIGIDFPIPLTIKMHEPKTKPESDGPKYQTHWRLSQS